MLRGCSPSLSSSLSSSPRSAYLVSAAAANCCAISPRRPSNFPARCPALSSRTDIPAAAAAAPPASKAAGCPDSSPPANSAPGIYPSPYPLSALLHPKPVAASLGPTCAAGNHPIRSCSVPPPFTRSAASLCATTSPATPSHFSHPGGAGLSLSQASSSSSFASHYRSKSYFPYLSARSFRFGPAHLRSFRNGCETRTRVPPGTRSQPYQLHYPAKPTSSSSRSGDRTSKLGVFAATSTFLALIGIYTVTEDPESESIRISTFQFPTDLLVSSRSLFDWWSSDPSSKPTTPPAPATPRKPTPPPTMAAIAPGRPETITPEQEIKLKEFWNVTLSLFGQSSAQLEDASATLAEDASALTLETEATETTADSSETPGKKSKRKMISNAFKSSKSKKDKDSKESKDDNKLTVPETTLSNRPSPPPGLTTDPEDKYNQGKDFKAALASQTPEQLRTTFWGFVKYDNPDALLLRFLRARKWDVEKALVMMVSTMHWRGQEVFVEDIVKEGELAAVRASQNQDNDLDAKKHGEGFLKQLQMGKSYIHGTDKENRPICFVNVKLHKAADQTPESIERYTIYLIETTRFLLKPPVDTAAILFDMTGFGMANMDYTPVKFMIKCFEAHYPECLGICLIHNAPWVFQGIWKIIRGWLDPVVAAKVHFTNSTTDLLDYIPAAHLPKTLGGEEDWEYKYVEPVSTENPSIDSPTPQDITERDTLQSERLKIIEEYEKNTRDWIKEESKGAKENTDLKDERSGLRERLRTNYWGLDRFLRAKTYYDRIGMVGKNGEIDFYPSKQGTNGNGAPAPTPAAAAVPSTADDDELD